MAEPDNPSVAKTSAEHSESHVNVSDDAALASIAGLRGLKCARPGKLFLNHIHHQYTEARLTGQTRPTV